MTCRARLASLAAGVLLPGCVVLPATIETYDPECRTVSHHMVLQQVQIAEINHCRNQECTMMAVAGAATVTVSAIVSGSIVIVGNAAYWIERRASCRAPAALPPVAPVVPLPIAQPAAQPVAPPLPVSEPD